MTYTAERAGAYSDILAAGQSATFTRTSPGTFDETTGLFSGTSTSTITGSAIQVKGDSARYRDLGLVLSTMPTLLVTPSAYPLKANTDEFVLPGDVVSWNSIDYTVKDVDPVAPDGYVIVARIIVAAE